MNYIVIFDSDVPEDEFVKFIHEKAGSPATKIIYAGQAHDEEEVREFIEEQKQEYDKNHKGRLH